jgi:hypothetical protein
MPIITQTLCDGCQTVKKETNHWYTLVVEVAAHQVCLRPMSHTPPLTELGPSSNVLYFCGRHCAIEAITQWMDQENERPETAPSCALPRSVRAMAHL